MSNYVNQITEITNSQVGSAVRTTQLGWSELVITADSECYDPTGISGRSDAVFDAVNEITEITNTVGTPWPQPTYDPAGNMTTIPWTKPGAARGGWSGLTTDDWSTLSLEEWSGLPVSSTDSEPTSSLAASYDAWNRLVTLTDTDTDEPVQHNHYDARTFRVLRQDHNHGVLSESRHFLYTPGWRCVEERLDAVGSSSSSSSSSSGGDVTADRQFVWGLRYIDDLILRDRSVGGILDERLYACQDGNWSVTAIAEDTGAVQERYGYDPYGATYVFTAGFVTGGMSDIEWETTYAGYRRDFEASHYLVRFRDLLPMLGWGQRDPIGYAGNSTHLFEYAAARPNTVVDASGLIGPGNGLYLPGITPGAPGPQYLNWNPISHPTPAPPPTHVPTPTPARMVDAVGASCEASDSCLIWLAIDTRGVPVFDQLIHGKRPAEIDAGHTYLMILCPNQQTYESWGLYGTRDRGCDIRSESNRRPPTHFIAFQACWSTVQEILKRIDSDRASAVSGDFRYDLFDNSLFDRSFTCSSWAEQVLWDSGFDLRFPASQPIINDPALIIQRCPVVKPMPQP